MKTYSAKPGEITREWYLVDADGLTLGRLATLIADTLRLAPVQRWLNVATRAWPEGPSPRQRQMEKCVIVAEAEDSWRRRSSARLETPDGYSFTAEAATTIARHITRGDFLPGFQTPAKVYGADFVLGLKGARRVELGLPFSHMQADHMI